MVVTNNRKVVKMKNLNNMFRILNDIDVDTNLATISIYDEQEGDCASFAIGFGASDDYIGDEMEALGDRLHAASNYSEIQEILETLPDRYTVSIDNISISQ